jgi:heparan-alpha-glucosaminide N-acetyltransferase
MGQTLDKAKPAPVEQKEKAPDRQPTPEKKPTPVARLLSLDAYRGFTMLAMVSGGLGTAKLLGDPVWGWLADQLEHRAWEGCTLWDLIQPSFMFIVGAAMPFAFALRQERGEAWNQQFLHVVKRSLLLIAIGILLDSFGRYFVFVQFIRVLQQIAIGYFLAFLVLRFGPVIQALSAVALLGVHSAAFILYGRAHGIDPWDMKNNIGVEVDRFLNLPLSTGHYVTINAISSAATILFGVLCGELLRSSWKPRWKITVLAVAGLGGLLVAWPGLTPMLAGLFDAEGVRQADAQLAGWSLTHWVPMVKRLWTASFAVFAAGWTCLSMLVFYVLIEVLQWRRWAFPFVVVGMNSIAIYVAAGTLKGTIVNVLNPFVYPLLGLFSKAPILVLDPKNGRYFPVDPLPVPMLVVVPIVQACLIVIVLWLFCYWLYRQRIFFKV